MEAWRTDTCERLRRWRVKRGLDQAEVAAAAAIAQSALSMIERGQRNPSLGQAWRIQLITGGKIKATDFLRAEDLVVHPLARRTGTGG